LDLHAVALIRRVVATGLLAAAAASNHAQTPDASPAPPAAGSLAQAAKAGPTVEVGRKPV